MNGSGPSRRYLSLSFVLTPWTPKIEARSEAPDPRSTVSAHHLFDEVYSQNVTFVWRTLRTMGVPAAAVADAAQDVFVVVHRKLSAFDGKCAIKTWLFHIVYRVACEHRRQARRTEGQDPLGERLMDAGPGPAEALERHEASSLLMELLAELDDDKRIVLVLTELEEMSAPEIAAITGTPLNTVYTRLRRARSQLSESLRARELDPTRRVRPWTSP